MSKSHRSSSSSTSSKFVFLGALVFGVLVMFLLNQYLTRPTQTICDRCSHKLIIQAKNGDQVAQQKLVNEMTKETKESWDNTTKGLVIGLSILFVVLIAIVAIIVQKRKHKIISHNLDKGDVLSTKMKKMG